MRIDIPTLVLTLLIGFSLLALQLWVAQRGQLRQIGLHTWAMGCWAVFLGMLVLVARVVMPVWLSALLGNWLISVGALFFGEALRRHTAKRGLAWWEWSGAALAGLVSVLTMDWPTALRTSFVSFMVAIFLLPALLATLSLGRQLRGSMLTVALILGLAVTALLVRAVWALLQPEEFADLLHGGWGQGLTFMALFMSLFGSGFGFVLACFERVAMRMEEMAFTDGLTGCLNRAAVDALLVHNIERAAREHTPLSFALLDLDHFKQVNDSRGHQAGDATLKAFAAVVRSRLRSSDVLGRMGGDEFCLVLPRTDASGAAHLLEQVRAAVQARFAAASGDGVTVSVGVAVLTGTKGSLSAEQVYALADQALYEGKREGRNRVAFARSFATQMA